MVSPAAHAPRRPAVPTAIDGQALYSFFECRPARLAIELDGDIHNDPAQAERDAARTAWLEMRGYLVLRFWNDEVLSETDAVVGAILDTARRRIEERYGA